MSRFLIKILSLLMATTFITDQVMAVEIARIH